MVLYKYIMKNYIFIHAALLYKVQERLIQYLNLIVLNNVDIVKIFVCFIGDDYSKIDINILNNYPNLIIQNVSNNLIDYELPTLQYIYNFSKTNPDSNILYLHTKNVGKELNPCIEDQIEYMTYFLINNYDKCINKLKLYETVGVDLREEPTLHYSGNFWWAKTNYISELPEPILFNNLFKYPNPLNSLRHNQEFWICYNRKKHYSLWDCGINCYQRHLHRYPKEAYISILCEENK